MSDVRMGIVKEKAMGQLGCWRRSSSRFLSYGLCCVLPPSKFWVLKFSFFTMATYSLSHGDKHPLVARYCLKQIQLEKQNKITLLKSVKPTDLRMRAVTHNCIHERN